MKILFITRKWPPAMGGMETWSAELAERLAKEGALTLRCLPGRADGRPPSAMSLLGFGAVTALRLLFDRTRYDLILGGDLAVWPLVRIAGWWAGARARLSLAAHGTDIAYAARQGLLPRLYRGYLRLAARWLRRGVVIANSQATATAVEEQGFGDVRVVALAARTPTAPPPPEPDPYLLFPGRLVRRKGLSWFVSEVLPRLHQDITLRVAGTRWDDSEAEALSNPRVTDLGRLDDAALRSQMAGALAVILPNIARGPGHFEGFGLVAVEAAQAGGVVLAARLEGYLDSVVDGETGLHVESGDAAAWAEAIESVRAWDPATRRAFTATAMEQAARRFSWERAMQEMMAIWRGAAR